MGVSLMTTGEIAQGRAHLDRAIVLIDPAESRLLPKRGFGFDNRVARFGHRSQALWLRGCPEPALVDADQALKNARKIGQAASLMDALLRASVTYVDCGNYAVANTLHNELVGLADEKGSFSLQRAQREQHCSYRSTYHIWRGPMRNSANSTTLGACIGEALTAVQTTKETWFEAEVHRTAGEIALLSPERDATKAEAYFERALAVARQQQAKSWELRATMSMARLLRDQGKRDEARALLAPVYGWFTEGFDTLDLKEAKALLDELQA
jgi:predicted ATPase